MLLAFGLFLLVAEMNQPGRLNMLFLLLWSAMQTCGQTLQEKTGNFSAQVRILPQEKLYLHTDKSCYITGEQMFFKAYLVDAMYHMPVTVSRYVYVEIINPFDSVVARVKVRPLNEMYYGNIKLSEQWADGYYRLRAYTHFMRNLPEEYFFSKTIYVADPISAKLDVRTAFHMPDDKTVEMELRLHDRNPEPESLPEQVSVRLNAGRAQLVKQKDGVYKMSFRLQAAEKQRMLLLETVYRGYAYRKFLHVPFPEMQYDVAFYPEGGQLVDGADCTIALKAQNADGSSAIVSGHVVDAEGNSYADFATTYCGMGVFRANLSAGRQYYARCVRDDGVSLQVALPPVQADACALRIRQTRDMVLLALNRPREPHAGNSCYLLVHQRGNILYADAWDASTELLFRTSDLSSGVVHFVLLDAGFNPVSERLVFVNNKDQATAMLEPDKEITHARGKVSVTLSVSEAGLPALGHCSVSVTDDGEVVPDTAANILSYLLLTSDLRGEIENPAAYFQNDKQASRRLDMLMLTQGWRRYDLAKALAGHLERPVYEVEQCQKISGRVQGALLLRPAVAAQVTLITQNNMYADMVMTDSAGNFVFDRFELPDTTLVLVQALSGKNSDRLVLTVNKDSFPVVSTWTYPAGGAENTERMEQYIRKEEMRYTYENGMRMVNLSEVDVVARKKAETRSAYTSYADQSLTVDQITKVGGLTVKKLLERMGSVSVDAAGTVSIRGKSPVLLLVNDVETDLALLDDMDPYEILRIDILQSTLAFGQKSANGVISISTRTVEGIAGKPKLNMEKYMPLGYLQPAEFYAPCYDTPEKRKDPVPDLRTTLYWTPTLRLDEDGKACFDFYSADQSAAYTLLLQGITQNGQVIYAKTRIRNQ